MTPRTRRQKPSGGFPRSWWLPAASVVAVVVVGGYLWWTPAGRSSESTGQFTPFQPAPSRPGLPPPRPTRPASRPPGADAAIPPSPPAPGLPQRGNAAPFMPFPVGRQMKIVDLNSASRAELEQLPAVTPEDARKIIAGRPYQSMADLERAIPHQLIEQISPPAVIRVNEGAPPPGANRAPPADH